MHWTSTGGIYASNSLLAPFHVSSPRSGRLSLSRGQPPRYRIMSYQRVGAVTGANKGIGFAIIRQIALQYPKSPINTGPLLLYLTARDQGRGEDAVKKIHDELKSTKVLSQDGGLTTVRFSPLDVSSFDSIDAFAAQLKKDHPEGVDFVINNAGIAMDGFDNNVVKTTLHCNYYGTLHASQQFLPLIKKGGRLVNVSSIAGRLKIFSPSIKQRFQSAKTVSDVTALMQKFATDVENGNEKAQGWPSAAYAVSKAGLTCVTSVLAREEEAKGDGKLVNSCCPGYVNTDMTKGRGYKTPDQGAMTPVMLALGDIGGKSGLFWQSERPIEW